MRRKGKGRKVKRMQVHREKLTVLQRRFEIGMKTARVERVWTACSTGRV